MSQGKHRRWGVAALSAILLILPIVGLIWPSIHAIMNDKAEVLVVRNRLGELLERRHSLALENARRDAEISVTTEEPGLLSASTETEAISRLDAYVKDILGAKGGEDITVHKAARSEEEGVPTLRVELGARLPGNELLGAVHELETGSPAIFFESLRLHRLESGASEIEEEWIALSGSLRVYLALPSESRVKR